MSVADAEFPERNGDGLLAGFHGRLYDMTIADIQATPLPDRDLGSLQSVRAFRRVTMSDMAHPDMIPLLHPDELNDIVDEAREVAIKSPGSPHFSYIEDSQYEGFVGLQTKGQEKDHGEYLVKLWHRELKRRKRAKAAGFKADVDVAPELSPGEIAAAKRESDKWKLYRRTQAQLKCDRWDNGFHQHNTKEVAGYAYPAFSEILGKGVLRSHLEPSLFRFLQLLPKERRLRAGMDKAVLLSCSYKIHALDAPYVELDRKRAGMVVVELDSVWSSVKKLREVLLQILGPRMMPQIIVGRRDANGQLLRPHLIWLLNPAHVDADGVVRDGTVWYDPIRTITDENGNEKVVGDKRCKMKAIRKFHAVQRSMVALLVPIGADPACHQIWRPKNPLSPYWSAICCNDDHWPILDDFETIPGYQRRVDEQALEEAAAKLRLDATGEEPSTSNMAWRMVGNIVIPMARLALDTREPDFLHAGRSLETLTAWFDARVRPLAEAEVEPSKTLNLILQRRCQFAANWCMRSKPGRRVRRGRDRDLILKTVDDGNGGQRPLTIEERITLRAERTNAFRHNRPMWWMCQELTVAYRLGGTVDKTAFIKNVGQVSTSFAYEHWEEACRMCGLEETDVAGRFRRAATKIKRSDYPGEKIKASLPSEDQQAIVSTVPCQPIIGYQFDSSDPVADHQRSTVNRPNPCGPPDQPWLTDALSSADLRQQSADACLEPA